jgi:hypothetical protein
MSKGLAVLYVKSQLSSPGDNSGKDVCTPKTIAVVQLPEILRKKVTLGTFFFDLPTADERENLPQEVRCIGRATEQ